MRWHTNVLEPLSMPLNMRPILIARSLYIRYGMIPFEQDLTAYLTDGFVVSLPHCFAMGKVVDLAPSDTNGEPQPCWFVRIAVGNLQDLMKLLPFELPRIAFCRRNDGKMRVFSLQRLRRLAKVKGEQRWAAAA